MREVQTRRPSFPAVAENALLSPPAATRWEVLCGDQGHWRAGLYSPAETSAADHAELEWHDCPELFLLISGRLTLLLADGAEPRELPLTAGRAVLVTAPHAGFCPDGPHSGVAFVVERDAFTTRYRAVAEWLREP